MNRFKVPTQTAIHGRMILLWILLMVAAPMAWSIGIMIPRQPEFSAIQLGDAEVRVEINNNVAKTRVIQEFFNPNSRQLEADFYFPVPKGADVTDFVLYMNGKPVKGEVLEKEKAREIYEGIVRRMQDPGLLEWVDSNLFKVRVFPVPPNGTQKIELEFAQPLQADQGMFKYLFPLKTPKKFLERGDRPNPNVKFTVDVVSDEPVRNIYSPSHTIDTDVKDPKRAKVTLTRGNLAITGDFVLFYEYSRKDIALSLLATRPGRDDGYFSLMLSPQIQYDESRINPKDVTFVVDTSGSMLDDNKIEQARKALTYCVSQLRPADRFNIVRFSTDVEKYRPNLQEASRENLDEAKGWIGKLNATGGTNISGALGEALELMPSRDGSTTDTGRVYSIVFITDGLPTVGVTNADEILRTVKSRNQKTIRIFTFGVGNDVNTKLLDRVADETRASAEYIRPGEDMEVPIGKFFDKINRPVLTGLKLEMTAADVYDLYPKELPDLFYGTQLTVFGRFKKSGPTAIRLSGVAAGKPTEFTFEKTLPEKEPGNDFVEKLWGTRKIAYLLDEIRAHGESSELKEETVRLAKKYGVVTPYTSYLVAEDQLVADRNPVPRPPIGPVLRGDVSVRNRIASSAPAAGASGGVRRMAAPQGQPMDADASFSGSLTANRAEEASGRVSSLADSNGQKAPASVLAATSGKEAVAASKAIRQMKDAEKAVDEAKSGYRQAGGKSFQLADGVWIDTDLSNADKPTLRIKYLSEAWFAVSRLTPNLREILALGDRIRVKIGDQVVEIGADGKDRLEPADEKILQP
ncbi:MAG: VWA domain-containing protein [Candidatus Sumerlaeaceae bacterium]|nr:VWA domain-containing protein [Candidatus Sumerlaeaceae bacterium]